MSKHYIVRMRISVRDDGTGGTDATRWELTDPDKPEHRIDMEPQLGEELSDCRIPPVKQREDMASPYVSAAIDPVVTVNVSKAKGYAARGCSGIANLIVLNCLYGGLCTAVYKKIQREHSNIPMLTMIYDGLKQTNEKTRIEAFMHQVKSYQERYGNSD